MGLGQKFEMLNISSSTDLRRQICKSMKLLLGFLKHCTSTVTIREVACYHLVKKTETYDKLPNLRQLFLSNNQISGCIPENIGEVLPNLSILDLSNNSISGFIPNSIGNMKVLEALDLSRNKLMGPIPTSMGNLNNMMTLVLRGNTLSEQIPSSLKNCTQLEVLVLGDNQLSGNLPSWIGQSLTSLRVLSLRSNKLIGAIPKTMSSLYSLQVFDAAENCLSGTIPDIFTNFTAMKVTEKMADYNYDRNHSFYYMVSIDIVAKASMMDYTEFLSLVTCIDLSRNNFSGRIPESLTKF
ncbi:LRR receptor-like serine/threonine-protein kinase GSO1 [Amborella trichopoda]|nr:LRR receptor-like serine/threonine-protein kinase GSO1 [Amborella trichopoda]|eukprot:XP_006840120.2 LRR receptor-like serine/threonine-protein kinase GSO1 [Amborella trichopoda]